MMNGASGAICLAISRQASFPSDLAFEAAAPTCQRQRSYKAVADPLLEAALHPTLAVADTTSSIQQQFDVAKWHLIRTVKRHRWPRRSHCPSNTTRLTKRNKVTYRRRRHGSRQVTVASHHAVNNAIGKATVSSDRRPLLDDL